VNVKKSPKSGGVVAMVEIDPSKFPPDRAYNPAWSREKIVGHASEAGYALAAATNDSRMHQVLVFRLAEGKTSPSPARTNAQKRAPSLTALRPPAGLPWFGGAQTMDIKRVGSQASGARRRTRV
jgi:hypothetical protein